MLKYLKIALFISIFSSQAQNDSIFLISGEIKVGRLSNTPHKDDAFYLFKKAGSKHESTIKSQSVYKIVSFYGSTLVVNNHYYLEKNKSTEDYRRHLEKMRPFGPYAYNGYPISRRRFFRIMDKVNDKDLNKLCRNYKILNGTAVPTIVIGGIVLGYGYIIFADNNEKRKHYQPYNDFSESTLYESIGEMVSGALITVAGILLESHRHKVKQRIIYKYNSLLLSE